MPTQNSLHVRVFKVCFVYTDCMPGADTVGIRRCTLSVHGGILRMSVYLAPTAIGHARTRDLLLSTRQLRQCDAHARLGLCEESRPRVSSVSPRWLGQRHRQSRSGLGATRCSQEGAAHA